MTSWSVTIDRELCMVSGMCVVYAAGTFTQDADAKAVVLDPWARARWRQSNWTKKERETAVLLEAKNAIITGSGSGVVCADLNLEGAKETVRLIEESGGTALPVGTDVSKEHPREKPEDDLISVLVQAEITDEDGTTHTLSDLDIYSFSVLLLMAGSGTTWKQLGILLAALLDRPEVLEAVREDRNLLKAAIEESLRWMPTCIGALLDRVPNLRLDPDAPAPKPVGLYERGVMEIPVVFG